MQDYRPLPQLSSTVAAAAGARGSLGNSVPTPEGGAASAVPTQSTATPPAATPAAPPGTLGTARRIRRRQSARRHRRARSRHQLARRPDRPGRSPAVSAAQRHAQRPRAPGERRPGIAVCLQTGLTGTPTRQRRRTWRRSPRRRRATRFADGATELRVPLTWTDGHGLTVTKTFVFTRGLYSIDLLYDVHNDGDAPRSLASYAQFLRHWEHASRSYFDVETYSFKGPAVFDGTKSRDLNVESESDSKFSETVTNGWLASLQHHFVSAIVPPENQPYRYRLQVEDHQYLLSATGPFKQIARGRQGAIQRETVHRTEAAVAARRHRSAPRSHRRLRTLLTVIAHPLFVALKWVHGVIGNWGWAIIIVTALIKLIFYPLSQASGRSMAKMRAVAPRMKQIQDTYKDDREKLGRAMMELYKREKINPLAGCLPMVVQIPVFISFYWVLLESVEMRQAPFMLWINDLSSRDPLLRAAAADGRRHVRAVQAESARRRIRCRPRSCSSCRW